MRKYIFTLLVTATLIACIACSKNDSPDDDADTLTVEKMSWVRITPQVTGDEGATYSWILDGEVISTDRELLHVFAVPGVYTLHFKVKGRQEVASTTVVTVTDKTCTNGITRVFEYLPAPGQFINTLPEATAGDTPETMRQKAEEMLKNKYMISLGGFGGYIIFGFDHTVVNREGNDFVILGNANNTWAEPGVIMVSYDANGNGLPDDEWFEIAGSEYHKPTTIRDYEITWYKPASEPDNPSEPNYIRWTDNHGQSGWLSKNSYHTQSYYPLWKGDSYTLAGTFMEANPYDTSGNGTIWVNPAYDWGYADNWANNNEKAQIDIDWAVDKNGTPVRLKGLDFIKVHTGNRAEGGWLGEVSTEISGFTDLNF